MKQNFWGAFRKLLTFLTDGSGYFENTTNDAHVDGHSARPHGGILKIRHVQPSVCVCSGGSCRETRVSPKNQRCPHILLKNSTSLSKTAVLTVICGGIDGFWGKLTFLCRKLQIRRRTRTVCEEFLKFLRGAANGGRQHGRSACQLPKHWSR